MMTLNSVNSRSSSRSPDDFVMIPDQNETAESRENIKFNLNESQIAWDNIKRFETLKSRLQNVIPQCKVHFYGSYAYEIPTKNSDLNIYIEFGKSFVINLTFWPFNTMFSPYFSDGGYHKYRNKAIMGDRQHMLVKCLKSIFQNVSTDVRCNLCPIIKAKAKEWDIDCTISFGTGFTVEASKRIIQLFSAFPGSKFTQNKILKYFFDYINLCLSFSAKKFVLFLRKFQEMENDVFKFTTYQLTMLSIWYFAYRKYIPTIEHLMSGSLRIICGGK